MSGQGETIADTLVNAELEGNTVIVRVVFPNRAGAEQLMDAIEEARERFEVFTLSLKIAP